MGSIPEGERRKAALKRIETLDCGNPNKQLSSCNPAAKPPREVLDWQEKFAAVRADDAVYARALAIEIRKLVCENDYETIYVLRGVMRPGDAFLDRLSMAGREAPALVDFIMSKDCPVSASLTDEDKAKLLKIKQDSKKKIAPPPASNKAK